MRTEVDVMLVGREIGGTDAAGRRKATEEKLVGFRKTGADQLEQATPQGEGGH